MLVAGILGPDNLAVHQVGRSPDVAGILSVLKLAGSRLVVDSQDQVGCLKHNMACPQHILIMFFFMCDCINHFQDSFIYISQCCQYL